MPRRHSAPKERLEAIETLLLWEGRVSRSRLLGLFDIHETLASRDIATFRAKYSKACRPDMGSKGYVASDGLGPTLTQGVFHEYQRLIGAAGNLDAVVAGVPVESSFLDATSIGHALFSQIHGAVRVGHAVRVSYCSMTHPEPHERVIRPHSLIQAGLRWHIRAYCSNAREFRDFNLGRISAVAQVTNVHLPGPEEDVAWRTMVTIRLVPHRDLSAKQARMVREEYMRGTTALAFEVRIPMARYLIQSLRAAIDPEIEAAPAHLLMVYQPEKLPENAIWPPCVYRPT